MKSSSGEAGYVSGMLIGLIVTIVLLLGAVSFATWAFVGRQDYKNNSDQKAAQAADERQAQVEESAAARYAEEEKRPLTSHKAPDQYGGVNVRYPKTWSGYVIEGAQGVAPVDNYFHPKVVPSTTQEENAFALRVQVLSQPYDKVIQSFEADVNGKRLTAAPYSLPEMQDIVGTRFDGQVSRNKRGSIIVLPLRNSTIKIWTESPNYIDDFNNIILPNLTFVP